MPFPDDLPPDWDQWLDEYLTVSVLLRARMGRGANRYNTLVSIAHNLKIDPRPLKKEGLFVLSRLIKPIEELLDDAPGDWLEDVEALRGHGAAAAAVGDINSLDAIQGALDQFGWGSIAIGRNPRANQILGLMRDALISKLAQNIYKMLDDWRLRDAWTEPEKPKGIVRASTRDENG